MDRFIKPACDTCRYAKILGVGTVIIEGKQMHFTNWGCSVRECVKEDEKEGVKIHGP